MKHIRIFIAGSKYEIEKERRAIRQIANFVQSSLSIRRKKDVIIQAVSFEEFPTYIGTSGHQMAYNKYISEKADIVFFIFRGKIGNVTEQEFNIAYQAYTRKKTPIIHVLSHKSDGISTESNHPLAVKLNEMGEKGVYYEEYRDMDEFQQKIRQDIDDYLASHISDVRFPHIPIPKKRLGGILAFLFICTVGYELYYTYKTYRGLSTYAQCETYINSDATLKLLYSSKIKERMRNIEMVCDSLNQVYGASISIGNMWETRLQVLDGLLKNMLPVDNDSLEKRLYVGKYEVSEREWLLDNLSVDKVGDFPKSNISYTECKEYIKQLNLLTGLSFRLPTVHEWETIAMASENNRYAGSNNCAEVAWYKDNAYGMKHSRNDESIYLRCNGYDMYDMTGNVAEWCCDSTEFNDYVNYAVKGGSYLSDTLQLEIAFTDWFPRDDRSPAIGFRLILEK